jgi:hypothetical protein
MKPAGPGGKIRLIFYFPPIAQILADEGDIKLLYF